MCDRFTHDITYRGFDEHRPSGPFAVNALSGAPVRDILLGLASVILGTLAVMDIAPIVLAFVALLIMGGALTFTASTICGTALITMKKACWKK